MNEQQCSRCGIVLVDGNTIHASNARWCDDCWTKFWAIRNKLKGDRQDIGCSDFEGAEASRRRQAEGYALEWWLWYENVVRHTPNGMPLGRGIPIGELPQIGKLTNHTRREE